MPGSTGLQQPEVEARRWDAHLLLRWIDRKGFPGGPLALREDLVIPEDCHPGRPLAPSANLLARQPCVHSMWLTGSCVPSLHSHCTQGPPLGSAFPISFMLPYFCSSTWLPLGQGA